MSRVNLQGIRYEVILYEDVDGASNLKHGQRHNFDLLQTLHDRILLMDHAQASTTIFRLTSNLEVMVREIERG